MVSLWREHRILDTSGKRKPNHESSARSPVRPRIEFEDIRIGYSSVAIHDASYQHAVLRGHPSSIGCRSLQAERTIGRDWDAKCFRWRNRIPDPEVQRTSLMEPVI